MIYVQKFRTNDLAESKGKQIEFNHAIITNFFQFKKEKVVVWMYCSNLDGSISDKIKVYLKLSPSRGDYKVYQNEDGSPDLKDFFLRSLALGSNNYGDYFAIKKTGDKYHLYYIPQVTLFENVYKLFGSDQIYRIPNNKVSLDRTQLFQVIYYGAPGTGKSYTIKRETKDKHVIRTTFHPDSDYSTFVGAYKPITTQVPRYISLGDKAIELKDSMGKPIMESRIEYEFVEQAFLQAYVNAWKLYATSSDGKNAEPQYLVIEEINRGNCAQIFGDLFQLLDRKDNGFSEYPITADTDMQNHLAKVFKDIEIPNADVIDNMYDELDIAEKIKKGEVLLFPGNLYILATMNTSDQSLFPIDSAFKRRWEWKYVPISKGVDKETNTELNWRIQVNGSCYGWWSFLEKINERIGSLTSSQDKKLGFFFCKARNGIITAEQFVDKVLFFIWNEVLKDYEKEQDFLKDGDSGNYLTFDQFYRVDANGKTVINEEKAEVLLNNLGLERTQVGEDAPADTDE